MNEPERSVPPPTDALIGAALAGRVGGKLVLDYRDPWTETLSVDGSYGHDRAVPQLEIDLQRSLEARTLARADLVLGVTPRIVRWLSARTAAKVEFLPNGLDEPPPEPPLPRATPARLVYAGSLAYARSLGPVLTALHLLRDRFGPDAVRLTYAGPDGGALWRAAEEAGVTAWVAGGGDEYKRIGEIAATKLPFIVPVNFPDAPDVSTDEKAIEVPIEELRQWQDAPGNPAALARAGVSFALTANGLKDAKRFGEMVGKAIARGLSADDALAAVTTTPARLLGLSDKLGTIAPGRIANLTVTRGALFDGGAVREVWVDGNRHEVAKDETTPKGEWRLGAGAGAMLLTVAVE